MLIQLVVQENVVGIAGDPSGMCVSQLWIDKCAECHGRALVGHIDNLSPGEPAKLNTTSHGLCPGAH